MKLFYDTEFLEDGRPVDLISVGELTADGTDYTAAMVTLAHQIGDKPA